MDSLAARCVEVVAEGRDGTDYGSGLRLATSLVVTARHVTDGGGPVRVRLAGGAPDERVVGGRTVWRGVRLDVALVELAPDSRLDEIAPMPVGLVPDEAGRRLPFTAVGFPRHGSWTDAQAATWRDSDQVDGVIPLGSSVKRGRLLLHRADGRRLEARDWSGFSGSGVVCAGCAVGVVVESAHSGGLEAVRLAAVIGAYTPRAPGEREPAPSAAAARDLMAAHGVVPQPLDALPDPSRRRPAYAAMVRQYAARCAELTGREQEFADLLAFATGPEPYLMLVAGPWAGKTSLVTHFAARPEPGLDVVSFVVSRRDGQVRLQQFHRAVCDQLAALMGEFPPAEPDAAAFLSLWERAVQRSGRRSLLLLVDGLDENDHRLLAEPSIASQLPAAAGPAAHVLATSRHAQVPLDVDESHPLRTCRRLVLAPFPAATGLLLRARQELDHVLAEPVPRAVLTAMTVAGGALSSRDIASISGGGAAPAVRRTLETGLSRVVEPRAGTPTRYTLAHDTLADAVREDLEPDEIAGARAAIDGWAFGFAAAGWPEDTPDYLTEAYPTLLLAEGAGRTLALLASPARRALLRRRTDGDLAALSELAHAARLLAADPAGDLTQLTRVSLLRKLIEDTHVTVPVGYPLLLVRLGRTDEGVQLARTLQNAYVRADALLAIGEHLLSTRPAEARHLIHEAMAVPGRLPLEQLPHTVRAALALVRNGDTGASGLARRAVTESGDPYGWPLTTVADALAGIDQALTRALMEQAIDRADAEDRPEFCGLLAPAFAALGDLDGALRHITALDRNGRRQALLTACGEQFAGGGRGAVSERLLAALNGGFTEDELVESAPYQDGERARRLLALPAAQSRDRAALVYTALAAHGMDPRRAGAVPGQDDPSPGAVDTMLAAAARTALANGHRALALSLARDVADPFFRADRLTDVALALLDCETHDSEAGDSAAGGPEAGETLVPAARSRNSRAHDADPRDCRTHAAAPPDSPAPDTDPRDRRTHAAAPPDSPAPDTDPRDRRTHAAAPPNSPAHDTDPHDPRTHTAAPPNSPAHDTDPCDTDSPEGVAAVLRAVEAALAEDSATPEPSLLAALARAGGTAGRTDLAAPALERAVRAVLDDGDDAGAGWEARAVAGAAAQLGRVDHVLEIAAAFDADPIGRTDILLAAARAVEDQRDHRSADLDLLIARITEGIAASTDPEAAGWRARVTADLAALHLRTGHAAAALTAARRLAQAGTPDSTLELRAHLLSEDIPSALALIRETVGAMAVQSPPDRARSQERAGEMIVAMCDAGHQAVCRDLTAQLAAAAGPAVRPYRDSGLWAHPWLAVACQATGLTGECTRLLGTLEHAVLVTGSGYSTNTVPSEAVVRLRLWDRYRADARRMNDVLAAGVLTDLVEAMCDAGLVTDSLTVIDGLPDDAPSVAYCLARAAAAASPPSAALVRRSLSHGFAEAVLDPLSAVAPACLDEVAAQLGVIPARPHPGG